MNDLSPDKPLAEVIGDVMDNLMVWREEIEQALAHAEYSYTFDNITAMVLQGQLELHTFEDCFALTQINTFGQFKVYHFMIVGGTLQSIIAKKDRFKIKAKELGCRYLSFSGRKGWEKALKDKGWEHKFTTMWSEVK